MLLLLVTLGTELDRADVADALLTTSALMLNVGCSLASSPRNARSASIPSKR